MAGEESGNFHVHVTKPVVEHHDVITRETRGALSLPKGCYVSSRSPLQHNHPGIEFVIPDEHRAEVIAKIRNLADEIQRVSDPSEQRREPQGAIGWTTGGDMQLSPDAATIEQLKDDLHVLYNSQARSAKDRERNWRLAAALNELKAWRAR